jgi:hypothetical protein
MPLHPQSARSQGTCPNSLFFHYFHLQLTFEFIKELESASTFNTNVTTLHTSTISSFSNAHLRLVVAPLLWPSVGVKPNTWKSRELESSGTPECSELDSKGQNTLHWGVLGVIEKVLKRKYRKCPLIGHLDICSPSYGQKKGRESNWQFDSRPLKVENRPLFRHPI